MKQIDDPRRAEGKLYDVAHVLLFTIIAMLSGANSYRQTHTFMHVHFQTLRDLFGLKRKKAPAYTPVRGIITQIDPGPVERVLRRHAAVLARDAKAAGRPRHIAIDGKALRHSFDKFADRKAVQFWALSPPAPAWCWALSNATRNPMKFQRFKGFSPSLALQARSSPPMPCIVKKTFEAAARAKANLIVQVKANQPGLHDAIIAYCDTAAPCDHTKTIDTKKRLRHETRTLDVFRPGDLLAGTEWAGHVALILCVNRETLKRDPSTSLWSRTRETSCYVANTVIDAMAAMAAIRAHWGIENRLHDVKDTAFAEDASRIRVNPGVFARLRSVASNLLRFNKAENIANTRYSLATGGLDAISQLRFM